MILLLLLALALFAFLAFAAMVAAVLALFALGAVVLAVAFSVGVRLLLAGAVVLARLNQPRRPALTRPPGNSMYSNRKESK